MHSFTNPSCNTQLLILATPTAINIDMIGNNPNNNENNPKHNGFQYFGEFIFVTDGLTNIFVILENKTRGELT